MTSARIEGSRIRARSVDQARHLLCTNDPQNGLVVLQARPSDRRGSALAQDFLRGLGKDLGTVGSGRNTREDYELCAAWARAMDCRRLTILDAQLVDPATLDIVRGCLPDSATLVVLLDGTTDDLEHWLTRNGATVATHDDLAAVTQEVPATPARPSGDRAPLLPDLPYADFTVFRAECRKALPPPEFRLIDARYTATFRRASAWLDGNAPVEIADLLYELLRPVGDPQLRVVILRAVQAAAFTRGYLVQVKLPRFLAEAAGDPGPAHLPEEVWRRLDVYSRPYRPAVCAVIAAGLSPTDAVSLTLADVDSAGKAVRHGGQTTAIPPAAAVFARAQLELRKLQGACENDPFIVGRRGPLTARGVARVLIAAGYECGIGLAPRKTTGDNRHWAERQGISIQEVA